MYEKMEEITRKPSVFGVYTAELLWTDRYRSQQMLAYHLNESIDISSRNHDFIEQSTQWITTEFSISAGTRVCDFGCGPGLYTSRLAKTGATVTGIDFSKNSIEYAQKQAGKEGLDIEYINASYLDVELAGPYDIITMIMCDFCALSPSQRKQLLSTFDSLLDPQGKIVLDVYSIAAFESREEGAVYEKNQLNHFWFAEEYYCFVNTFKYEQEKVMLDKYSLYPESRRSEIVYNWLQYYDLTSLKQELAESGFLIKSFFSDVCGHEYDPNHTEFAVVLEKAT